MGQRFIGNCIETHTGRMFDLANPSPSMVCIEDIAHGLANESRFGGHTREFYSVAQHSVLVCRLVLERAPDQPDLAAAALIHDAPEAYAKDLPSPLKALLPGYRDIERRIMAAITQAIGLPRHWCGEKSCGRCGTVLKADLDLLRAEATQLLKSGATSWSFDRCIGCDVKIVPLRPTDAKQLFLDMWDLLK